MKREFLTELGITEKDVIDKIMAENGNDIENAKSTASSKFETERGTLQEQIKQLQEQVSKREADVKDVQEKLKAAQDNAEKLAAVQESMAGLQSKYDTERKEWEAKNAQQAYEFAVKERASALNFSSAAAKREFVRDAIEKKFVMENDKLMGFDDYVASYKESDPGAFVPEKQDPDPNSDPPGGKVPNIVLGGNSNPKTKPMSLSDMMAAKNANPNLAVSFDKQSIGG